jgi:hypothetical protein
MTTCLVVKVAGQQRDQFAGTGDAINEGVPRFVFRGAAWGFGGQCCFHGRVITLFSNYIHLSI